MSTPTTWPEGDVREQRRTRTADPGVPGSVPESTRLAAARGIEIEEAVA